MVPSQPSGPSGPTSVPKKTARPIAVDNEPVPKKRACVSDEDDDDFDRRFGHLFNTDVNNNINDESDGIESVSGTNDDIDETVEAGTLGGDDDAVSVDNDLVDGSDHAANWELSSSVTHFIKSNADKPLSEDFLKQLSDTFTPTDDLQQFFAPPKMPKRLFNILVRMKSKAASKTERALYNAQAQLFIVARPIVNAIKVLKPLGADVSEAREMLGVSLRGMYSVSLAISKARRENVRFLFKPALADALYEYEPSHKSLFGGSGFVEQITKASKEA